MSQTHHEEYQNSYKFEVTIEGLTSCIYESVSGLAMDIEDIPYYGDQNIQLNRPGRAISHDIILTRRFHKESDLYSWIKDIKNGKKNRKNGAIILKDEQGKQIGRYNFSNAWPKHWTGPELSRSTNGSNTLLESIILSVTDIEYES
jgi:phage tail-like protein